MVYSQILVESHRNVEGISGKYTPGSAETLTTYEDSSGESNIKAIISPYIRSGQQKYRTIRAFAPQWLFLTDTTITCLRPPFQLGFLEYPVCPQLFK